MSLVHVPTVAELGADPTGPDFAEDWNYRSVVGMMMYLSTNTRPDIAFAVSQVARFGNNPKQSHGVAVKRIVRYLKATSDKGTIVPPITDLSLDDYVDADFLGLHGREVQESMDSARSRTGYIIKLGGFPLIWKSQLQTAIATSTMMAEYCALSSSIRTLIPIRRLILELVERLGLSERIRTTVHEDNNGALALATNQRVSARTRFYNLNWHFFWEFVKNPENHTYIVRADTKLQDADLFTKALVRATFDENRRRIQGW